MTTLLLLEKNRIQNFLPNKNKVNFYDNRGRVDYSAGDFRSGDNRASFFENQYFKESKKWLSSKLNYISGLCGKEGNRNFIGLSWQNHARKVYHSFDFAEKIKNNLDLHETVEIWPEYFPYSVYKFLLNKEALPKGIEINRWAKIYMIAREVGEWLYCTSFVLLYSEVILIKLLFARGGIKRACDVAVNIEGGKSKIIRSPQELLKKTIAHRHGSIVFINNGKIVDDVIKEKNYKYADKIIRNLDHSAIQTFYDYLTNDYIKNLRWKFWSLIHIFLSPLHSRAILKSVVNYAYWTALHRNLKPKVVLSFMVRENLIASYLHDRYECKSMFVYFSTTPNCIVGAYDANFASCYDYAHIRSSYIYSSPISNAWLRTQELDVDEFVDDAPIYSGLIRLIKRTKQNILQRIEIDTSKLVITFFDASVGYGGVVTELQYLTFINAIDEVSERFPEATVIFKSKYPLSYLERSLGDSCVSKLDAIRLKNKVLFAENLNLTGHMVIGISDIVISLPMSSIIYEALTADTRVIVYNDFEDGTFTNETYESFNNYCALKTIEELVQKVGSNIKNLKNNVVHRKINSPQRLSTFPHIKMCKLIDRIMLDSYSVDENQLGFMNSEE
jgi:hypothetical protein